MATPASDTSADSSNEVAEPGSFKHLIQTYTALPAPEYLSSGMPNVWRLRMVICDDLMKYDKAAGKLVLQPTKSHRKEYPETIDVPESYVHADDGWESITFGVELTPFDLRFGKPLFIGHDNFMLLSMRETAEFITQNKAADSAKTSFIGLSLHMSMLHLLCTMFTDQERMDAIWASIGPELKSLMKPLGGWRPAKLVVHDSYASGEFSCLEDLATGKVTEEQLANAGTTPVLVGNDLHVGAVPHRTMTLYPESPSRGQLVVCANCGKNGVQDGGHGLLSKYKRCGGCQVHWYCNSDCRVAHWEENHKTHCSSSVTRAGYFSDEPRLDRKREAKMKRILRETATSKPSVATPTVSESDHWLKKYLEPYIALPCPSYLPSGLPNVWLLRFVIWDDLKMYDKAAGQHISMHELPQYYDRTEKAGPYATLPDGWESLTFGIELVPFDFRHNETVLEGPGDNLDNYIREGKAVLTYTTDDFPAGQSTLGMSPVVAGLYLLCTLFTNASDAARATAKISPTLSCLMPPLGAWRPGKLVVHDVGHAQNLCTAFNTFTGRFSETMLNQSTSGRLTQKNYLRVGAVQRKGKDPLWGLSYLGASVCCPTCKKIGVQDRGHRVLPTFKRCGGCGVDWYCSPACREAYWEKEHKNLCKVYVQEAREFAQGPRMTPQGEESIARILRRNAKKIAEWEDAIFAE